MKDKAKKDGGFNLTEEQQKVTDRYVGQINKTSAREVGDWTEKGKLISGYLDDMRKVGYGRLNYHNILAEHPECPYGATMLRYWEAAWLLKKKVDEDADCKIDLPMSIWVKVLHLHKGIDVKISLLKEAQAEHLTVAKFKDLIHARFTNVDRKPARKTPNRTWEQSLDLFGRHLRNAQSELMHLNSIREGKEVPVEIAEGLVCLCRTSVNQGWMDTEVIELKKAA